MENLDVPDLPLVPGHLFASLDMTQVRILCQKKHVQVLEAYMNSDHSIRKAVKKISLLDTQGRPRNILPFINELTIMHNADHPHVLKMDRAVMCEDFIAVCMPLCSRGTLADLRGSLGPDQVERFFLQIACALRYLHNKRIVHGDVKPGNVFIHGSNNAILSDFGQSRLMPAGQDTVTNWGGATGYIGPECFHATGPVNAFLMDAYALGATLWSLVFRLKPVNRDLLAAVKTAPMPELYRSTLAMLLQKFPHQRQSVHGLLEFLCSEDRLKVIIDGL